MLPDCRIVADRWHVYHTVRSRVNWCKLPACRPSVGRARCTVARSQPGAHPSGVQCAGEELPPSTKQNTLHPDGCGAASHFCSIHLRLLTELHKWLRKVYQTPARKP